MSNVRFALIGDPLGHSMSAVIHKELFAITKTDADYVLYPVSPARLQEELPVLRTFEGFNVTIPHKCTVMPFLDDFSPKASLYGAVNTVKCGETLTGHNTDCDGFLRALKGAGIPLRGHALICGAGGVARMAAFECALHGCRVTIATREQSAQSALVLQEELRRKVPDAQVETGLLSRLDGAFDLLVNGTPVGMHPHTDAMAVPQAVLERCGGVFDTIYNPLETRLVQTANAMGIPAAGGLAMLVWQAAAAQELWLPVAFTQAQMETVIAHTGHALAARFGG